MFHFIPWHFGIMWLSLQSGECCRWKDVNISIPVLLIVGLKCTLAALHAAPCWVAVIMQTEQTNGCQSVTLHFLFDAVSVISILIWTPGSLKFL